MRKNLLLIFFINLAVLVAEDITYNSPLIDGSVGVMKSFIKSLLLIALMFALFVWWKRKILPGMSIQGGMQHNMKIVEKLMLDYTTTLYLVEVGGQYQVYGVSNKNLTMLNNLKGVAIKSPVEKKTVLPTFKAQLDLLTGKTKTKKKKAKA